MRGKELRKTQGITLIALVITIIVLLILAGVSVSMLSGNNGVLQKATEAKQANQNAEDLEKVQLAAQAAVTDGLGTIKNFTKDNANKSTLYQELGSNYQENGTASMDNKTYAILPDGSVIEGKEITKVIDDGTNTEITFSNNTNIIDEYGNVFILPAGFKVTNDARNVTKGIVIEDVSAKDNTSKGNQFVWVPVGDVKYKDDSDKIITTTIKLGRYVFKENDGTIDETLTQTEPNGQLKTSSTDTNYYTDSEAGAFKTSANLNHGYYIGRYEAGDSNATTARTSETEGTLVCKKDQQVYNCITRTKAKDKSTVMYSSTKFTSDLINSFAWDTTILFEQTFDNRTTDKTKSYSRQNSLNTGSPTTTGTTDKICNIYDMASNVLEWTTETYSNSNIPCVSRGGNYFFSNDHTSYRNNCSDNANVSIGFRPLLYL